LEGRRKKGKGKEVFSEAGDLLRHDSKKEDPKATLKGKWQEKRKPKKQKKRRQLRRGKKVSQEKEKV